MLHMLHRNRLHITRKTSSHAGRSAFLTPWIVYYPRYSWLPQPCLTPCDPAVPARLCVAGHQNYVHAMEQLDLP